MNPTAQNPSPLLSTDQERELRKIARAGEGQNPKRVLRAHVLLHLHEGRTVAEIAPMFFLCEKTVRNLRKAFRERGLEALDRRPQPPRGGKLTEDERQWLRKRLEDDPPRSARQVCQIVWERFGVRYSRRGAGNLMRRLGFAWNRPQKTPRVADEAAQRAFREAYRELKENLPDDEAVFFFDAVHPEHQVRPAHGWWREGLKPAVRSTSGRRRVHVLGALNLENGDFSAKEVPTVNGAEVMTFLVQLAWARPDLKLLHVVLDNAGYNHSYFAKCVERLFGGRIRLHFLPPYTPHLNPIERLWGVLHQWITHNRWHPSFADFRARILQFLDEVTERWDEMKSYVTDRFRVITHDHLTFVDGSVPSVK